MARNSLPQRLQPRHGYCDRLGHITLSHRWYKYRTLAHPNKGRSPRSGP